jgi:ribosomal protein L37AE/L43A
MTNSQRAWISIAKDPVGLNYGVHDGYDDEPSNYYEYDSKVGNHKQVNVGDLLFIRSGEFVLGFGQIESISITNGTKSLRKCPSCNGRPESRKTAVIEWRCFGCKKEFTTEQLRVEVVEVLKYRATYSRTWQDANHPMTINEVFPFQANNDTQSAIRKLDPVKIPLLISVLMGTIVSPDKLNTQLPDLIVGGYSITVAKRRRGQQEFRLALLKAIGSDCLISGPNPECVLEAAHIRSFAEHESHELNGGLLLRRDFHSLFDRRLIRVNPKKWTVEASPAIRKYETYNAIHLREIQPPEKNPPNEQWLMDHYNAAESVFA